MQDKPSSLTHRAMSGMVWVALGSGANAALKVLVLILLTRLLTPADFGVVGAALIVIGFSLTFSQMGLGPALVQRPALEPRHISTAFFASTALGALVGLIIWLGAPALGSFFRMPQLPPLVRVLAIVFPITGLMTVAENLLQRELRFRFLANCDVVAYGFGYGLMGVVLAKMGWGAWALVGAQLTQTTLRAGLLLWAVPPALHPRPSRRAFMELMEFGIGQSASRGSWFLANQADNFVVGRWLGAVPLGLYSRAYQLMAVPTALLGDVLDKVLFPTMARVQDDPQRLASAYLQATAVIALLTLPVGIVSALLAPELVAVGFGPKWASMVLPFQVLAVGMMFRTNHRMSDSLSNATGRVYRRAWRQALYAAFVFLGALVGQTYGVTGVAVGVLMALFLNYLMMAALSLEVAEISWLRFAQAQWPAVRLTTIVGVTTLATALASRHFDLPPLGGLLLGSAAALASAGLLAWLAPGFALGDHGLRIGSSLRALVQARLNLRRPLPGRT